jgi:hypothetical protein
MRADVDAILLRQRLMRVGCSIGDTGHALEVTRDTRSCVAKLMRVRADGSTLASELMRVA